MNKVSIKLLPVFLLIIIIVSIYYKFFIFGNIPFPGDLLVASYSPWFDYYKIPVQNPLISDVFSLLFIWKYLAIDQIKTLNWPLWNPYSFAGTPLLANYQSAALNPLIVLLLLPKSLGWGLFIFTQTLIAALSMYLLLSCWLSSKLSRLTGSIIFALGGLMTTWTEFGTAVGTMSYLPISIFAVERYTHNLKMRYLLVLTVTATLTILAGNPQTTVYSFVIISIFALFKTYKGNILKSLTSAVPLFLAALLALALSAPQLLPTFDLVQKSIRALESYTGQSNFGLLPLTESVRFFVADFFGNPVTQNYWGYLNYFETSSFVGSMTLPLIIFAFIFLKKNRLIYFFLLLFASSLTLSFNNPLSHFLYSFQMPFLTQSYASRMLFVTTFAISVLAAFALNQIKQEPEKINRFKKCILWSWAAFIGISIGTWICYKMTQQYNFNDPVVSLRNSLLPAIEMSFFLIILLIVTKINALPFKKYRLQALYLLLFVILTLDLSRYFLKFNPFVPENLIFPQTPALEFLQKQTGEFRVGREHAEVLPPNTWAAYKLQSLEGYDVLHLLDFSKIINHINGNNFLSSGASRYEELTNYKSPFIDISGLKYFIVVGRDKKGVIPGNLIDYRFDKTGYKEVFKDGSAIILENPRAFPKAYFAKSLLVAPKSQIESTIANDQTFDPRLTSALSLDLDIDKVTGRGKAEIINYTPSKISIKTQTDSDEVLILADQYEQGWEAKIDGKPTRISPANLIFRAVKVPSGSHEIIFNYYPRSFDLGLKTATGAIFIIILLILFSLKTKRF